MLIRAFIIWIGIALMETLLGVLRVRLLNRKLGDRRARRLGVLTGTAVILAAGWFAVPWIGPSGPGECIMAGALWLALMLIFDVAIGRLVFHFSWQRIISDFDVTKGNFLAVGMAVLFFTPLIVAKLNGLY